MMRKIKGMMKPILRKWFRDELIMMATDEYISNNVFLNLRDNRLSVDVRGERLAKVFTMAFWDQLSERGVENYVELNLEAEDRKITVTIQNVEGITPGQMVGQLKEEIIKLKEQLNGSDKTVS